MKEISNKFSLLIKDPTLRLKTLITFGIILVFRIFAYLPVPAIDLSKLRALFAESQFLSLLDIFSGVFKCGADVGEVVGGGGGPRL